MISIRTATPSDLDELQPLALHTFHESHDHSASVEDIEDYVSRKLTREALREELQDAANIFHLAFINNKPVGYSKIMLNFPGGEVQSPDVTKLERIYVLRSAYGQGVGQVLLNNILDLACKQDQSGIWLYTWIENHRAIAFYKRNGFEIVGNYDFPISATHVNPNYQLFRKIN